MRASKQCSKPTKPAMRSEMWRAARRVLLSILPYVAARELRITARHRRPEPRAIVVPPPRPRGVRPERGLRPTTRAAAACTRRARTQQPLAHHMLVSPGLTSPLDAQPPPPSNGSRCAIGVNALGCVDPASQGYRIRPARCVVARVLFVLGCCALACCASSLPCAPASAPQWYGFNSRRASCSYERTTG